MRSIEIQGEHGGLSLDFVDFHSGVPPVCPFAMDIFSCPSRIAQTEDNPIQSQLNSVSNHNGHSVSCTYDFPDPFSTRWRLCGRTTRRSSISMRLPGTDPGRSSCSVRKYFLRLYKACTWLRDFLPIFLKTAVRQTMGGPGAAEGNSKPYKPFSPTQ